MKKLFIYSPKLDEKCGGIVILNNLVHVLNYYNIFEVSIIHYDHFDRQNTLLDIKIGDDDVVIYPEVIYGNPLKAKNVIRFILLGLGFEVPFDIYKTWSRTDVVYQWQQWDKQISKFNQLYIPYYDSSYTNQNLRRDKNTCYLIKKAWIFKGTKRNYKEWIYENVNKNINNGDVIDNNLDKYEIINKFNRYKYFHTYDPITAYITYAIICGCIPIIEPISGYNRQEYIATFLTNKNCAVKHGFAYGATDNELYFAKQTQYLGLLEARNFLSSDNNDYYARKMLNEIDANFKGQSCDEIVTVNDYYNINPSFNGNYINNCRNTIPAMNKNKKITNLSKKLLIWLYICYCSSLFFTILYAFCTSITSLR